VWESMRKLRKYETVRESVRKCAKSWEKHDKVWERMLKVEKLCESVRKCGKSWESMRKCA